MAVKFSTTKMSVEQDLLAKALCLSAENNLMFLSRFEEEKKEVFLNYVRLCKEKNCDKDFFESPISFILANEPECCFEYTVKFFTENDFFYKKKDKGEEKDEKKNFMFAVPAPKLKRRKKKEANDYSHLSKAKLSSLKACWKGAEKSRKKRKKDMEELAMYRARDKEIASTEEKKK